MMLLLFFLLGSTAHAFPAVGDYIYMTSKDGYSKEAEVLSYDKTTKEYHAKYTERLNGKIIDVVQRTYTYYNTSNSQWIEALLVQCQDAGGEFQNIHIDPLGNFETCLIEDPDSGEYYNAGRTPFGVLQGELWTSDGHMKYFTLQKYRFGI